MHVTNSAVFSKECCMEKNNTVIRLMFNHTNALKYYKDIQYVFFFISGVI